MFYWSIKQVLDYFCFLTISFLPEYIMKTFCLLRYTHIIMFSTIVDRLNCIDSWHRNPLKKNLGETSLSKQKKTIELK